MTIATRPGTAKRPHRVRLQNPGPAVGDGDGGYTQSWTDLTPPALWMAVEPATAQTLERVGAGTTVATATHIISGPFHPGVTTKTRILFDGREFHVNGVRNREERGIDMDLVCTELIA